MCITSIKFFWLIVTDILQQYTFIRISLICGCGCTPWNVHIQASIPYFADLWFVTRYNNSPPDCSLFIVNSSNKFVVLQPHTLILCRSVYDIRKGLTLALFVLRILTDDHDASFSFDDFAFFANRFNWWSYLHSKSSFLCKAPFFTGFAPFSGYFSKSVRITL